MKDKIALELDFQHLPKDKSVEFAGGPLEIPFGFFNPFELPLTEKTYVVLWQNRYKTHERKCVRVDWSIKRAEQLMKESGKFKGFEDWLDHHYGRTGSFYSLNGTSLGIFPQNEKTLKREEIEYMGDALMFPELAEMDEWSSIAVTKINKPLRKLRGVAGPNRMIPGWAADADKDHVARAFSRILGSYEVKEKQLLFCLPDMAPETAPAIMEEIVRSIGKTISQCYRGNNASYLGMWAEWAGDSKVRIWRCKPNYILVFNPDDKRVQAAVKSCMEFTCDLDFERGYNGPNYNKKRGTAVTLPLRLGEVVPCPSCNKKRKKETACTK